MNIIFFGTPYFAAYHLEALINSSYNIVAVVTTPDTQKGRGRKIHPPPVKELALSKEKNKKYLMNYNFSLLLKI